MIIAAGSDSLKFISELHERFVVDPPIVFCAVLGQIPAVDIAERKVIQERLKESQMDILYSGTQTSRKFA